MDRPVGDDDALMSESRLARSSPSLSETFLMSITSTSSKDNLLALATPTALTEAASLMMFQARLLYDVELSSVPQIRQLLMDTTNAVIEASAMIATFPLEVQASLANDNAASGEDSASTIVTATPSQVGLLTHHNQELHHLLQSVYNEVTTVRN